ncbi:hypothetical protein GUJ93_ZPchr0010g10268 [Zizania palustris]|uniref:Terpene synthase n=1 Tax=Zizania palustris TaxID=103762 RepID=A0A8J5WBT9_ZIZPA|nr:hypothetical protein GUJ93_ZPchr0010g10268 [Zizania palustris]
MRERANQLKTQLRHKLEHLTTSGGVADTVALVDTLERLGVDNHFRDEIATALLRVLHNDQHECAVAASGSDNDDLHVMSLRFRLLRQHGFMVSTDVFDKFRDNKGNFKESLSGDTRGLLSLYNAAHLAMPGEEVLDDAIAFSRRHLQSMEGKLMSPMAEQVARALDTPLPRAPKRLETMCYIAEYSKDPTTMFDDTVLELARLDFELLRFLHLRELKDLSLWWREVYDSVKLSYARDRLVECYFWTYLIFHEEEYSRARIIVTKVLTLTTLMDDTYDIGATTEECHMLNKAIQRWDKTVVSILPEYLHEFYTKLLSSFAEFEDILEPHEKYRMSYAKSGFKQLSEYYHREVQWSSDKYMPSFSEHVERSVISSVYPMLAMTTLVGVHDAAMTTAEVFEWLASLPDLVRASAEVGRFLNDIVSNKIKRNEKDFPNTVDCYMEEHGVGLEAAMAAVAALAEHAWRTVNRAIIEVDDLARLSAAQLVMNLTQASEVMYHSGQDRYTFAADLNGVIANLFLDPIIVVPV